MDTTIRCIDHLVKWRHKIKLKVCSTIILESISNFFKILVLNILETFFKIIVKHILIYIFKNQFYKF